MRQADCQYVVYHFAALSGRRVGVFLSRPPAGRFVFSTLVQRREVALFETHDQTLAIAAFSVIRGFLLSQTGCAGAWR